MGKVIRVRFDGLQFFEGAVNVPLSPIESDVHVRFLSDGEVTLYAENDQGQVLPLLTAQSLDQTFHFQGGVEKLSFVPRLKSGKVALAVSQAATAYKDNVDPTPNQAIIPIEENSLQTRVMRMVNAALEARGLAPKMNLGQEYGVTDYDEDDENIDPEFGRGYSVDPTIEQDIENLTRDELIKRMRGKQPVSQPQPGPVVPNPESPPFGNPPVDPNKPKS